MVAFVKSGQPVIVVYTSTLLSNPDHALSENIIEL